MIKGFAFAVSSAVCLLAATTAFAYDINDIQRAASASPRVTGFARPQEVFEYDLKVQDLCDAATSLNTVASVWIGPKRGGANPFSGEFWEIKDRSVALAAVVTFLDARGDDIKQVKVPLLAKTNFGDAIVQNCDGTIINNVKANARVKMHFEFKRSEKIRFNDPTKLLGGIAKVGSSAVALGALPTSAGGIGAVLVPAVSFLEKNTSAITTLNTGVNEIMESFADERAPDPRQYEIGATASKIVYRSRNMPIITIVKNVRGTGVITDGLNGWLGVYGAFTQRYGDLQGQFSNAQTAVDAPWSGNLPKFCSKLRNFLDNVTKGDRFATALAVGYHAFYNSTEYGGRTCLNSWEIAALKSRNFAPPFQNAWPTEGAPAPAVASSSQAKQKRASLSKSRVQLAGMN
ncbi:hypothetical protein [Bradyrhizobium liaoningense]|uniref:hypothetical protein n=1 Tax=Bradyrhizobium liaoningense TaxID=43992 RepID=UPI001BA5DDD9|nr:hypothetical protein [Bradyrhizobium liaoningense]MBR0858901.1 hypothetical protein [Bradyrhizobium liaoningense]